MTHFDPANLKPGEFPPVPTTRDELLIEALRFTNRVSGLLNEISVWADVDETKFDELHTLLLRRFSDCSGVHLFIAANNIGVELPADLDGASSDDEWVK